MCYNRSILFFKKKQKKKINQNYLIVLSLILPFFSSSNWNQMDSIEHFIIIIILKYENQIVFSLSFTKCFYVFFGYMTNLPINTCVITDRFCFFLNKKKQKTNQSKLFDCVKFNFAIFFLIKLDSINWIQID